MTSFHQFLAISVQQTTKMSHRNYTVKIETENAIPLSEILTGLTLAQFPNYTNIQDIDNVLDILDQHTYYFFEELIHIPKCHHEVINILAKCLSHYDRDHTSLVLKLIGSQTKINKLKATYKWFYKAKEYREHGSYCYPIRVARRLLFILLKKFIQCAERGDDTIDLENIMEQIDDQ